MVNILGERWIRSSVLSDGHSRTIRCVTWSPCDKLLTSTSFDGTTAVWDRKNGEFECALTLEGHENEVKCAAWSPSGQFLGNRKYNCDIQLFKYLWEKLLHCKYKLSNLAFLLLIIIDSVIFIKMIHKISIYKYVQYLSTLFVYMLY